MKKIISIKSILTAAAIAAAVATHAQHTLGVFGGAGIATARFYPAQETKTVSGRYDFGLSWRYYSLPRYVGAVGVDLELFHSLTLAVDYFTEHRYNIFMQRNSLAATAGMGATVPYANLGEVDNRGVDISASYNKVVNEDLTVGVRGTFTYAHNEVKAMDEPQYPDKNKHLSKIGHPMQAHKVLVAEGLFTSQEEIDGSPEQRFGTYSVGDIKYKDINGDNVIDANDYVWDDTPYIPEIQYGFGGNMKYKAWDFSFMFQGTGNVQLRMYNHHPFATSSNSGFGITQYIADNHWSWDNNRADAEYPRLTSITSDNNTQASTYYLRKSHYLRTQERRAGLVDTEFPHLRRRHD